jgi:hypothetical protein
VRRNNEQEESGNNIEAVQGAWRRCGALQGRPVCGVHAGAGACVPSEHREEVLAKAKTYYEANREAILAKQRAYREAHREELRAYATAYRKANREEILAKQRQRRRGASSSSRTVEGSEFAVAAAARG